MTSNFLNVVGKFTLENVKELKDNILVNEESIMDSVTGYINQVSNEFANVDHTHNSFDEIKVNKINDYIIGRSEHKYPFIPMVRSDGVMSVGAYIDFFASPAHLIHSARIYVSGNTLMAMSNGDHFEINTTIIHNAPVDEDINNFQIGAPVFTSGSVYHLLDGKYISGSLTPTDCITSVKTFGSYRQYLGICCAIHKSGEKITIGEVLKQDVKINQDTVDFATHGDFYFRVNDSSEYSVGDIVLFDGNKLDDELIMTAKITSSIVGKVTGIIDEHLLCVFKD